MGKVIVVARIMPKKVDTDLDKIIEKAREIISKNGDFGRAEKKPIAFGLKAIEMSFVLQEKGGLMDRIEEKILEIPGVQSYEVLDVRRAL